MKTCPKCAALFADDAMACPSCAQIKNPRPAEVLIQPVKRVENSMFLDPIGFLDGEFARYYTVVFKYFAVGIVLILLYGCMLAINEKTANVTVGNFFIVGTTLGTSLVAFVITLIVFGYTAPFHAGVIGLGTFALIYSATSADQDKTRAYKSLARTWRITFALELFLLLCYWFYNMFIHKGPLLMC